MDLDAPSPVFNRTRSPTGLGVPPMSTSHSSHRGLFLTPPGSGLSRGESGGGTRGGLVQVVYPNPVSVFMG